jgi:nitroreductase
MILVTNQVIDCLLEHRSIRRFDKKPIEPEVLELILQAGMRAPTAGNLQHYSFIVVDDPAKKRELVGARQAAHATVLITVVDEYRLKRWFELNDAPFYFDQAVNLFIAYWDAIVALQNACVAAESLGLGTVHIGTILSVDVQALLGFPEYVFPAGMALVGYPAESPELKPRLPTEAVVHRNGYHIPNDDEIRTYFAQKDRTFEQLSEEQREAYAQRGIHNTAQRVTNGHYTARFIASESKSVRRNLARAGFRLHDGE